MPLNFRSFDLNLLRVFDAVMAEGSLTRAADTLAMTQPAVSHAMKRLREAVGEDLVTRTAHGVRPSSRAEQLWPRVRETLASLRDALAPDSFDPRQDGVHFRLAMADASAALLSPALVHTIERERLAVSLRVLPLTTRDPRALLDAGEADLAVGFFPEAITAIVSQGQGSHLRHARLYDTRYVCAMRQGHPLAGQALSLDTFCDAHHLLVSFSGKPHGFTDEALAALGRQRRIVLTVNQFFTAARVVARSDLLTVLPDGFAEAAGFGDQLLTCELPLALAPVHVEMVWHLRHDADPAHRWLREQMRHAVLDLMPVLKSPQRAAEIG